MLNLLVKVDESAIDPLIRKAIVRGFKREDPRKSWKYDEKRQAIKFLLHELIKEEAC